jgi:DNA repair exonuclease SbcCD ATPase subunit
METPIPDLMADLKNIKSAVEFARWRDRLKMQAPDLYRVFFPTPKPEEFEDVTSKLVNIEVFRLLRQIREEMEGSRPNNLTSLQSQLEGYKEELTRLREELHKKDIDFLTQTVQDLKQQINSLRGSTSDLVALVREAKDLGEKWIRLGGGPLAELFLGQLGFVKVPASQTKVITEEAEQSEKSLIEKFTERGWVAEG